MIKLRLHLAPIQPAFDQKAKNPWFDQENKRSSRKCSVFTSCCCCCCSNVHDRIFLRYSLFGHLLPFQPSFQAGTLAKRSTYRKAFATQLSSILSHSPSNLGCLSQCRVVSKHSLSALYVLENAISLASLGYWVKALSENLHRQIATFSKAASRTGQIRSLSPLAATVPTNRIIILYDP